MPRSMGLFFNPVKFTTDSALFTITARLVLSSKRILPTIGGKRWFSTTKTSLGWTQPFSCTQQYGKPQVMWMLSAIR